MVYTPINNGGSFNGSIANCQMIRGYYRSCGVSSSNISGYIGIWLINNNAGLSVEGYSTIVLTCIYIYTVYIYHIYIYILYIYMGMDQYLLIPVLGGWTSINPSYFDVNRRGTRFWHTAIYIYHFSGETRFPQIAHVLMGDIALTQSTRLFALNLEKVLELEVWSITNGCSWPQVCLLVYNTTD